MDKIKYFMELLKDPRKKAIFKLFLFFVFFVFVFIYVGVDKEYNEPIKQQPKTYLEIFKDEVNYDIEILINDEDKTSLSIINDYASSFPNNLNYFKKNFIISYIEKGILISKNEVLNENYTDYLYQVSDHYFDFDGHFNMTVRVKENKIEKVIIEFLEEYSEIKTLEIDYIW